MAKKNKLEQVLEYLVAGDEARAKDLLHQVFIDKARAIHEELISADDDMDEETLGGDEGKQLRHDMMHHSDHIDELSDEIDSEEIMGEDEDLEMDADMDMADAEDDLGDAMSDVDDAEMDDEDAMSDDVMGDIESTMGDLETALADLKAEFEKLEGGSDDADMGDDILGHRSLNGHGRDIGFADLDIQPAFGGNRAGPEPDIAVGDRQPVQIIRQFQADRIVDQHALMIAQRHIFALPVHLHGQIARREDLRQPPRIRPFQLHLPLASHIPLADPVDQPPVFLVRFAKGRGHQHVVIGGKAVDALLER